MNKGLRTLITTFFALASLSIFANGYNQNQLPNLPEYYAYAPPEPTLSQKVNHTFRWIKNFYITWVSPSAINYAMVAYSVA